MASFGPVFCVGVGVALLGCAADGKHEADLEFSNLRVEEVAADRGVVRFDTNVEATCEVEYGTEAGRFDLSATDPDMDPQNPFAFHHRVPLEDLPAQTLIHFRAKATTRSGRTSYAPEDAFETLEAGDSASSDLLDVALLDAGAHVSAVSSNFGGAANDQSWGADAAFDGQMSTEWSTNGDGDDAYVELELQGVHRILAFGFRSRMMTDGSSIIESVRLIIDGETELGPFETPDPDQHYEFELQEPVEASVVRVEAVDTTGGNTGAKEIELYANE